MGFLKFLKREKKLDVNELDLPPEPPPLEGFEDRHDFDFPEIKAADDFDMSKFDAADAGKADDSEYWQKMPEMKEDMPEMKGYDMPDFPKFPETGEAQEAFPEPEMQSMPLRPLEAPARAVQPMPAAQQKEMPESEPQHMQRRSLFHHERSSDRPARKEVYVRVDKFKSVLDSISMIRSSVRKSDEVLMRLESMKNSKDRSFDRVKSSLEDLQKKLIFIDKTLFKGD